MRDSILRVIDDLETRYEWNKTEWEKIAATEGHLDRSNQMAIAYGLTVSTARDVYAYSIRELRKVIDDHGKS